jgi:hypothetical protein
MRRGPLLLVLFVLVPMVQCADGGRKPNPSARLAHEELEADSKAMHEWYCAAAKGHGDTFPCKMHALNQLHATDRRSVEPEKNRLRKEISEDQAHDQADAMHEDYCAQPEKKQGRVCVEYRRGTESKQMIKWFCEQPEHERHGPCLKHKAHQEFGLTDRKRLRQRMEEIDEEVPNGEQQHNEMHDDWCADAVRAEGEFCRGWAEHKEALSRDEL